MRSRALRGAHERLTSLFAPFQSVRLFDHF
jgi:hypothetical protein